MANTGGVKSVSGTVTATTGGVNTSFGDFYGSGYIANTSTTIAAIIYLDETADVAAKAQTIPALATFDWNHNSRRENGHTSFRCKTGSSTADLLYHAGE